MSFKTLPIRCIENVMSFLQVISLPKSSLNNGVTKKLIKRLYFKKDKQIGLFQPNIFKVEEESISYMPVGYVTFLNINGLKAVGDKFFTQKFGIGKKASPSKLESLKIFYTSITEMGLLSITKYIPKLKELNVGINFEIEPSVKEEIFTNFLKLTKLCLYFSYSKEPLIGNFLFSKKSNIKKMYLRRVHLDLSMKFKENLTRKLEILDVDSSKVNLATTLELVSFQTNLSRLNLTKNTFLNHKDIKFETIKFPPRLNMSPLGDVKMNVLPNVIEAKFDKADFSATKYVDKFNRLKSYQLSNSKVLFNDLLKYLKNTKLQEFVINSVENSNFLFGIRLSEYKFASRLKVLKVCRVESFDFDIEIPYCQVLQLKETYVKNETLKEMLQNNIVIHTMDLSHNREINHKSIQIINDLESLRYLDIRRTGFSAAGLALFIRTNKYVETLVSECETIDLAPIKALKFNTSLKRWESNMGLNYDKDINIQKMKKKILALGKKKINKSKLKNFFGKFKIGSFNK